MWCKAAELKKKTKTKKQGKYKENIFLPVDAVVEDTAHVREHKHEIVLILRHFSFVHRVLQPHIISATFHCVRADIPADVQSTDLVTPLRHLILCVVPPQPLALACAKHISGACCLAHAIIRCGAHP